MVVDWPVVVTTPRWPVLGQRRAFRQRQQTWSLAIANAYIV